MTTRTETPFAQYLAFFLVSACIIALELLHMRVLSLVMWQSLVYTVFTISMLGFGASGAFLSVWRGDDRISAPRFTGYASLFLGLAALITVYGMSLFTVEALRIFESPRDFVKLLLYLGLLLVPYFIGASVIAFVLSRFPQHAARFYGINMMGSGFGCILFLVLITPLGAPRLLLALVALIALASALFFRSSDVSGRRLAYGLILVCAALVPVAPTIWSFEPSVSKILGKALVEEEDLAYEFQEWTPTGRIDVVSASGFSWRNPHTGEHWKFKYLTTDGDAWTPLYEYDPERKPFIPHEWGALQIAYHLKDSPEVVLIGVGGAKGIREAVEQGATRVLGIELNPAIVEAVRTSFTDYLGGIAQDPRVEIVAAEGRSYIKGLEPKQFDVLLMNGVDTWAALSSGAYAMAENYLYTKEAFHDYLDVLRDDGLISISRRSFREPRETFRLATTALEALEESGIEEPWRHLAVMEAYDWATLVVKKSPLTETDIQIIERRADEGWHNIIYRPGIEELPTNEQTLERYGKSWVPSPYNGDVNQLIGFVKAQQQGDTDRFYREYPYDVRPSTDDDPFFFKYYKFSSLLSRDAGGVQWNAGGGSLGLLVLIVLLLVASVAIVAFVFVPLLFWSRREGVRIVQPGSGGLALYFLGLGLGYMFIEIALMQKLALFLGHPTYSIATVLTTMLVFSGLGSIASGRMALAPVRRTAAAVLAICILLPVCLWSIQTLTFNSMDLALSVRNLISAALLAPLAFVMGIPFPSGLALLRDRASTLIPWAWGINGAASVLASVLSIIIAMNAGFTIVLGVAGLTYLGAAIALAASARNLVVDPEAQPGRV